MDPVIIRLEVHTSITSLITSANTLIRSCYLKELLSSFTSTEDLEFGRAWEDVVGFELRIQTPDRLTNSYMGCSLFLIEYVVGKLCSQFRGP